MRKHWNVLWFAAGLVACNSSPVLPVSLALFSVTPASGPTTGGTMAQLLGSGFTPQTVVSFDGMPSSQQTLVRDGVITALVPSHLGRAGLVDVRVEQPMTDAAPSVLPKSYRYFYGALGFSASADTPATGPNPWFIHAEDLDGDGNKDLIVSNYTGQNLSVFLGKGDGSFRAQANYPGGRTPFGFAVGDLDGDGKKDLVVGQYAADPLQVLYGKGDGTFEPSQAVASLQAPRAVRVADLNKDGFLDVVTANYLNGSVAVVLGQGGRKFASPIVYPAGSGARAVAVGDFDGRNGPDIAVWAETAMNVSLFLNRGDATFSAGQTYLAGTKPVSGLAVDMNNDGKLDLVSASASREPVLVHIGNGDGTFVTASPCGQDVYANQIVSDDWNLDGTPDIAVANYTASGSITVLPGLGNGRCGDMVSAPAGKATTGLVAADFDRDGKLDIIACNSTSQNLTFLRSTAQ